MQKTPTPPRGLCAAFLGCLLMGGGLSAAERLNNTGFENHASNWTNGGWQPNSWPSTGATPSVQHSLDTTNPRSGQRSLRVNVTSLPSGSGTIIRQDIASLPAGAHVVGAWLRGTTGLTVDVRIRRPANQNYASAANTRITFADNQWYFVSNVGAYNVSGPAEFTIQPLGVGTVWIDDATVRSAEMITNPGFEDHSTSWTSGGWKQNTWSGASSPKVSWSLDSNIRRSGSRSLRVNVTEFPSGSNGTIVYQDKRLIPGQGYHAKVWLRGTPGMTVELQMRQPNFYYRTTAVQTFTFPEGTSWHLLEGFGGFPSYDLNTDPNDPKLGGQFVISPLSTGTVWIDDASLTPLPNVSGPTRDPASTITERFFGIHINKYGSYTLPQAPLSNFSTIRLWDTGTMWRDLQPSQLLNNPNFEDFSGGNAASWGVHDWGVSYSRSQDTTNKHAGAKSQRITISSITNPNNYGLLLVQGLGRTKLVPGERHRFTVWVRGNAGMEIRAHLRQPEMSFRRSAQTSMILPNSNWHLLTATGAFPPGTVNVNGQQVNPNVQMVIESRSAGTFNVDTATVTSLDKFNWTSRMDFVLSQAESLRAGTGRPPTRIIKTLGGTPTWASSNPTLEWAYSRKNADGSLQLDTLGGNMPPHVLEHWKDYVDAVSKRYAGRIHVYEIWNEADYNLFWRGGRERLLELAQAAYSIIKANDRNAQVITPNITSTGYSFLSQYLELGGANYADAVAIHIYSRKPELAYPQMEAALDMASVQAPGLPVWNTEGATVLGTNSGITQTEATGWAVRSAILMWASGIKHFNWYAWDIETTGRVNFSTLSNGGYTQTTPASRAYFELMNWLIGARITNLNETAQGHWIATLRRGNATQYLVWHEDGNANFYLPPSWGVTNYRTLQGGSPVAVSPGVISVGVQPRLFGNF